MRFSMRKEFGSSVIQPAHSLKGFSPDTGFITSVRLYKVARNLQRCFHRARQREKAAKDAHKTKNGCPAVISRPQKHCHTHIAFHFVATQKKNDKNPPKPPLSCPSGPSPPDPGWHFCALFRLTRILFSSHVSTSPSYRA